MLRDEERIGRIQRVLSGSNWDALVCTLPSNVLLLSGYWPVIGSAVAIFTREAGVIVLAPEDERELAEQGWADEVRTFEGGSLHDLKSISENVGDALRKIKASLGFRPGSVVACEASPSFDPSTYASTFIYGAGIQTLLGSAFPDVALVDATTCLSRLRSVVTDRELNLIRQACAVARDAFLNTSRVMKAGMREFDTAALLRSHQLRGAAGNQRCDGFAYCMSGPDSAQAYAAFQQTRSRTIKEGDFVLLHCNSYCGGFWTDITRTFSIGPSDPQSAAITDAVLEASHKAISAVRPGIKASAIDQAARDVLDARGHGKAFRHATGHGVGFAAINHNALPRIHPLSDEVLEPGMVFNIEPAVYIPGKGGMRQCNMVAVTDRGAELLTGFQNDTRELNLHA
jgi:Xaa-Pro aminopeptidase